MLRLPPAEWPFCWHVIGPEPWHRASVRWMSVLSDVSIRKRRTRDAILCRVDSRRPSDERRCAVSQRSTRTPIVNCGCARTCRVHAQCVAGGVRVSRTMVHHRISHNATLPSEDHTSTPWTGSVAIGHRSPRLILPRADLLHTVISTPLPYVPVPAYVTFRASASSFGPSLPLSGARCRTSGAASRMQNSRCKLQEGH